MTSRERIQALIAGEPADRTGFWLGNPDAATWPLLHAHFGTRTQEDLRLKLNDDFRWICPQFFPECANACGFGWRGGKKTSHGQAGPFADCEDPRAVEDFPWPDPSKPVFDACLQALRDAGPFYRASGMWTCFYHNVMDLFGMEDYMVKMYTHPAVVHAVTDRVCQFYYDVNERFFPLAGSEVDAFFFGNDFGTQLDLICGPAQFDEYILPWFRRFTEQGHRFGKQVILHSCGAIHRVIPRLLDAGVDCLHPLQALARDMDAGTLARDFKGKVCFLGGVDTQQLLVHGTPRDIRAEVRRLRGLLGPRLIVSPSHEALLPNVPPENVAAMAEAATAP